MSTAHGFLSRLEIGTIGFRSLGSDVNIDRAAVFYGAHRVTIGSHVRIDAYTVISAGEGGIWIGDHVHIATFVALCGAERIALEDFSGVSGRSTIYSSNDDYHGYGLTGPTIPMDLRKVKSAPVRIGRHAVVGAGCVVLPGVTIGDFGATGALSLVKEDVPPFMIAAGIPARVVGRRVERLLELEGELLRRERAKPSQGSAT